MNVLYEYLFYLMDRYRKDAFFKRPPLTEDPNDII
jgi:hypothetical protein